MIARTLAVAVTAWASGYTLGWMHRDYRAWKDNRYGNS